MSKSPKAPPDNVVKLVASNTKAEPKEEEIVLTPNPDIIAHLEVLLESAKIGELTEIFTVSNYYDGYITEGMWVGETSDPDKMVGCVENTKFLYQLWASTDFEEE